MPPTLATRALPRPARKSKACSTPRPGRSSPRCRCRPSGGSSNCAWAIPGRSPKSSSITRWLLSKACSKPFSTGKNRPLKRWARMRYCRSQTPSSSGAPPGRRSRRRTVRRKPEVAMEAEQRPATACASAAEAGSTDVVAATAEWRVLRNRTFDEIAIVDSAFLERSLSHEDIQLFALQSGGVNSRCGDPDFPASTDFQSIAQGMYGGALISAVLGTRLPGPGTVYVSQDLRFPTPVRVGDRLTVRVQVTGKDEATRQVTLACTCLNQEGAMVVEGRIVVVAPAERIERTRTALPELRPDTQGQTGLQRLLAHVAQLQPIRVAVVHPCDAPSLSAALEAHHAGLIEPLLIGPRPRLEAVASEAGLDLSGIVIVDTPHSHAAAQQAAALAARGEVEALMKGSLHTDELMSALVSPTAGLRTKRRISHCFLLQTPAYPRPFIVTDAAINIAPNLAQKADIIRNAIDLAQV